MYAHLFRVSHYLATNLASDAARSCYPSYIAMHSWRRSTLELAYTSGIRHLVRATKRRDTSTRSSLHPWVSLQRRTIR
jgi:hypothetical protein